MIFLVVAIYIGIGFFGSRSLVKKKCWREVATFFILLSFGFVLIALQALHIKIPSPGNGITFFVEKVLHLGYK